jgi:hypothetical protein
MDPSPEFLLTLANTNVSLFTSIVAKSQNIELGWWFRKFPSMRFKEDDAGESRGRDPQS